MEGFNYSTFTKIREEFLFHILQWDPKLFSIENENIIKLDTITPLKLKPASLSYDSFDDYYQTQLSYLIYHFWYHLNDLMKSGNKYNDIYKSFDSMQFKTLYSHRYIQIDSDNNKVLNLRLRSIESINCDVFFPSTGNLVKLKNPLNDEEHFALVKKVSRDQVDGGSQHNLTYEIVTKYLERKNIPGTIIIEPVTNLLSTYMTLVDSLINIQHSPLCKAILEPTIDDYKFSSINDDDNIVPVMKEKLNPSQLNIVERIIKTVDDEKSGIFIVSAPAATGKTTVIVSSILSIMNRSKKNRILVSANSNSATDSIVLELMREELKIVGKGERLNILRFGPEDKIHEQVKPFSFARLKKMQSTNVSNLLKNANVIFSTLISSSNYFIQQYQSDLHIPICIVDEAVQSKEVETFIPIMLGVKTIILFGDPQQLCLKTYSKKLQDYNLGQSLILRAHKIFENEPKNPIMTMDTQYRMDESIVEWPNKYFYKGALKNCASIRSLGICNYRVLNHSSPEEVGRYVNLGEAKLVVNIAYTLLNQVNLETLDTSINLGIIALSDLQRDLIKDMFDEKSADISEEHKNKVQFSVTKMSDAFQGSQCDIIILSCVRSVEPKLIDDPNRLCVSLTRAKHTLIICGNFTEYKQNKMWDELIKDSQKREKYFTVDFEAESIKQYLISES